MLNAFNLSKSEQKSIKNAYVSGDFDTLKSFYDRNVNIFEPDCPHGGTGIHYAIRHGQYELAKELLILDPTFLTRPDDRGITPLHAAADAGKLELVDFILNASLALPRYKKTQVHGHALFANSVISLCFDKLGKTPLYYAIANNHPDVALAIIAHEKELMQRTTDGDGLITDGRSLNACNGRWDENYSPLFLIIYKINQHQGSETVERNWLPVIRALLEAGADINRMNTHHDLSHTYAFHELKNNVTLAALLWPYHPRLDLYDGHGETPLHKMARLGHTEVLVFCLNQLSLPDAHPEIKVSILAMKNENGKTALDLAKSNKHDVIIGHLLAHEAPHTKHHSLFCRG